MCKYSLKFSTIKWNNTPEAFAFQKQVDIYYTKFTKK